MANDCIPPTAVLLWFSKSTFTLAIAFPPAFTHFEPTLMTIQMQKSYFTLLFTVFFALLSSCEVTQTPSEEQSLDPTYNPEARLTELGITLPTPPQPVANYVNGVQAGKLIFLAGKGPKYPDGRELRGKVGKEVSIEEGYDGARMTAINQMAVLKQMLGDLSKVKRVVKVLGMVNCDPDFVEQPKVINGFSDLIVDVFGERGKHARAAVGMASLPRGQSVEIEMIVEIY